MSWVDDGLERGGGCNECGEEVEEEHHAYCAECFASQQGWATPAAGSATRWQREDRERIVGTRTLARLDELERRVLELEGAADRHIAAAREREDFVARWSRPRQPVEDDGGRGS